MARSVGFLAVLCVLAGGRELAAQKRNEHGFIESDQWACLVPLSGIDCAGGEAYSMLENWVAPIEVSVENPVIWDEWKIDFGGKAKSAAWLGKGHPHFESIGKGIDPDVVDWEDFLEKKGLPKDFVMGIAATYVNNTTLAPLEVGLCTASDDSIQVWINNTLALNLSTCRGLDPGCSEVTPIVLAPGVNRITVLVWQGFGGFSFRLGLRKPNGTPLTQADTEIAYLGASSNKGVTDPPPFLTRSYYGSYFDCPNATHVVTLSGGAGFKDTTIFPVLEELRGAVSAASISSVSDGGAWEDILPDASTVEGFHSTVVGTPCSTDNWTSFSNGTFTTHATTGGDIWADGDTFELAFQRLDGDFDLAVEVLAKRFPEGGRWGKLGLMARQSLDASSKFTAILDYGPDPCPPQHVDDASCVRRPVHFDASNVEQSERTKGMLDPNDGSPLEHPRFLRLTRRGSLVEAWVSNSAGLAGFNPKLEENWKRVCSEDWTGPPEVLVGFVYSVHNSSGCFPGEIEWRLLDPDLGGCDLGVPPVGARIAWNVAGAVLSSAAGVSYSVSAPPTLASSVWGRVGGAETAGPRRLLFQSAPQGLAGELESSIDIGVGGPCSPGSVAHDSRGTPETSDDIYTITASGFDIWDEGDQFHFAYKAVTGDFAMQARFSDVKAPSTGGRWGKYGLMARWDCRPDSAYFFAFDSAASDPSCSVDAPRGGFRTHDGLNGGSGETGAVWWQDVFGKEPMSRSCDPVQPNPRGDDMLGDDLRGDARNQAPWLRLVRRGNTFYGYASDLDSDWRVLGSCSWPDVPDTMVVGVAVTSHASCVVESVTVDHLDVGPPPSLKVSIANGDPLEGAVIVRSTFDEAGNGTCAPGWICNRWGTGMFSPRVVNHRLRLADLRGSPLGSGEDTATSAFLADPIDLGCAYLFDFDARFTYDQDEVGDGSPPGDGLAFCVLGTRTKADFLDLRLGDRGGGLGFSRINMSLDESKARSRDFSLNNFAVELDCWHNDDALNRDWRNDGDGANVSGWNPTGGADGTGTGAYHIGLDVNASTVSAQRNLEIGVHDDTLPDIFNPAGIHMRVLYDHGHVQAWVRSTAAPAKEATLVLDDEIEPVELNSPLALVGFTAATGDATCVMEVDNFEMRKLLGREVSFFHRGDADDNGVIELTDAVRILGYLFLGVREPPCLEAADADDNGVIELTDAVRILGYLFLGTAPPAAPGPPPAPCGPDRADTPRDLGCASYSGCGQIRAER